MSDAREAVTEVLSKHLPTSRHQLSSRKRWVLAEEVIAAVRDAVLDDLIAEAAQKVQACAGHLDDEASWIDTTEWLRSRKDQP